MMNRWHRLAPWQRDAIVSFPLAVGGLIAASYAQGQVLTSGLTVLGAWGLISTRRVAPWLAFLASAVLSVAAINFDATGAMIIAFATTLYTVVAYHDRARPIVAGAIGMAVNGGTSLMAKGSPETSPVVDLLTGAVLVVMAVQLGRSVRVNRQSYEELRQRAVELERLRATEANEAVLAERARIARELHDIAAHHVSGIAVLSRAQARRPQLDVQAARDALDVVAREASEAMTALRSLVGVLRTEPENQAMQPQPGLHDIDELIGAFTRIGMTVTLLSPLPTVAVRNDVGLAAYRIVQEALANVMRHSPGSQAWVNVQMADDVVSVQIDDNGRCGPASDQRRGHGTIGMSERAQLCGGMLDIATSERGGWCVRATLAATGSPPVAGSAGSPGVGSVSRQSDVVQSDVTK
jgi:signal transduction histidine kinase